MATAAAIPFSSWRVPEPVTAAAAAAAVIGATLGFPAACLIFARQLRAAHAEVVVAVTTAILSYLVVFIASRSRQRRSPAATVLLLCVPAGALNAGMAAQILLSDLPPFPLSLFLTAFAGSFCAAPLALAFGAAYAILAWLAARAAKAASHQAHDLLLGHLGLAVLLAGAARALWVGDLASTASLLLGAGVALAAYRRAALRRRWLADVAHDRVEGFAIIPSDECADLALPCVRGEAHRAASVLVQQETGRAPYRSIAKSRRLARVSL